MDKNMGLPMDAEWNYPEDYEFENGQYIHNCRECNRTFHGHKRRGICKVCQAKAIALTEEAKNELSNISDLTWRVMGMSGSPHADLRKNDYVDGFVQGFINARNQPTNTTEG